MITLSKKTSNTNGKYIWKLQTIDYLFIDILKRTNTAFNKMLSFKYCTGEVVRG